MSIKSNIEKDHVCVQIEDSSGTISSKTMFSESPDIASSKLEPDIKTKLEKVELFDITKNKQFMATVDSNCMLRVYKIKDDFQSYEEMSIFEIYNSGTEERAKSSQLPPRSSTRGICVYNKGDLSLPPFMYMCLSISDDGRFISLSIATLFTTCTHFNIYSTGREEKIAKIPAIMDQNDEEFNTYGTARPLFLNDTFILVTEYDLHVFNLKFEKLWTKKNPLDNSYTHYQLYDKSSCNFITASIYNWDNYNEKPVNEDQIGYMYFNLDERRLLLSTEFLCQDILLQNTGSDVTEFWNLKENKLLTSMKLRIDQKIITISDDQQYFVIFDVHWNNEGIDPNPFLTIYSAKTKSVFHRIKLDRTRYDSTLTEKDDVMLVPIYASFDANNKYLFLSGFMSPSDPDIYKLRKKNSIERADKEFAFFEVWNVPAQRLIYHNKYKLKTNEWRKPVIFIDHFSIDQISVQFISVNNDDTLQCESFQVLDIAKAEIKDEKLDSLYDWKEWEPTRELKDSSDLSEIHFLYNDINIFLDDPIVNFKRYMLDYKDTRYILLFGEFTIQMWQLAPIEEENPNKRTIFEAAVDLESNKLYHRTIYMSNLIYIQCYDSILTDFDRIVGGEPYNRTSVDDIEVEFNVNGYPGRTFVKRYLKDDDSEKKSTSNYYFDELFLPMERLENKTSNSASSVPNVTSVTNSSTVSHSNAVNATGSQDGLSTKVSEQSNNNRSSPSPNENSLTVKPSDLTSKSDNNNIGTQNNKVVESKDEKRMGKNYGKAEFHYFEGAIRTLSFFEATDQKTKEYIELTPITERIKTLIGNLLKEYKNTEYFATEFGSHCFYFLSKEFPVIAKEIITLKNRTEEKIKDQIPLSIFNYVENEDMFPYKSDRNLLNNVDNYHKTKVNALTELSEGRQSLCLFLFYHVLVESLTYGFENMVAITELFLYLQKKKETETLLKCIQMISYFPVPASHPIEIEDIQGIFNKTISIQNQGDILPFALSKKSEENQSVLLQRYLTWLNNERNPLSKLKIHENIKALWSRCVRIFKEDYGSNNYEEPINEKKFFSTDSKILCVVPLPEFNMHTHNINPDSSKISKLMSIFRTSESPFTRIASSRTSNTVFVESDVVVEALTVYKWKKFARRRFLWILLVYAIYYISFSVGVGFAEEVFSYTLGDPLSHRGHFATTVIMFISWFVLFLQELRQFLNNTPAYMNPYNFIDWLALSMPLASFALLLTAGEYLDDVRAMTTLILWIHGMLRLRAFYAFGTTLEFIIQMSLKTMPFIGIFCSVVVAFTHTYIVLLRQKDDEYFQEQFSGILSSTDAQNSGLNGTQITFGDSSSQNDFTNPFKAFSDVWFLIYGVWDPLNNGDAGDNPMISILSILFSFIMGLIFLNMIIALMSSAIEDVQKRGMKNWIHHLAAVVAEVELFWCSLEERLDDTNNPNFVYYIADKKEYEKQNEKLWEEYTKYVEIFSQGEKKKSKNKNKDKEKDD